MAHVSGAGAVAFFTAYIPFGHSLGLDVVVDRVAAVTKRPGWPLQVVRGIKRNPPVRVRCDHVSPPDVMGHIPLRPERIVVVTFFREVTLFPLATVHEGNIVLREFHKRIRFGEIGKNGVRVNFGVTDDISHSRFPPTLVDGGVTGFAGSRADELQTCGRRLREQKAGNADYRKQETLDISHIFTLISLMALSPLRLSRYLSLPL